jgi:hypothetical protein
MVKKLLDEILVYDTVSGSLEYPREKHAILSIRQKDVIPTIPVKASNLDRSYTEWRPADTFVTPRLVDVNEMVRTKL